MKLLVTGAAGLLGHELVRVASRVSGLSVVASVRRKESLQLLESKGVRARLCDVSRQSDVEALLAEGFDVVTNCAGVTKRVASDPIEAIGGNSLAPHVLAKACTRHSVRLIHLSTDCVFSGKKGDYSETDVADPVDLYGHSKLLGEVSYDNHLTIRTSFIGFEQGTRHGLLEWFLAQQGVIDGYESVFWSGLTSLALSELLIDIAGRPDLSGLLHLGGDRISKLALLQLLRDEFNKSDVEIRSSSVPVLDRTLDSSRAVALGIRIPPLADQIKRYARLSRADS